MTGVAIAKNDPVDPRWQLQLIITSLFRAITDANVRGNGIRRVGMLPDHLLLHKVSAEEASRIIEAAYAEQYPTAARE